VKDKLKRVGERGSYVEGSCRERKRVNVSGREWKRVEESGREWKRVEESGREWKRVRRRGWHGRATIVMTTSGVT
jgi:hypothetical protein